MKSIGSRLALALVAVVALSSVATAAASAAPIWKFNGTELSGNETIVGGALSSSLAIPGATTTCAHFLYNMKIKNSGGTGKGEITEVPLYECSTSSEVCTVTSVTAEKLPWPTHLETVGTKDYLFVEGVFVTIVYAGNKCALAGRQRVSGTAGGVVENSAQTATFDKATFEATGAVLKVGSSPVEWNGVFPTEGFETHREQLLEG
jgi:hypothetical protein